MARTIHCVKLNREAEGLGRHRQPQRSQPISALICVWMTAVAPERYPTSASVTELSLLAIADVTPDLHGPAGSLLNLMRALGTSLGVAAGATTLNWRLEAQTGAVHDWQSSSSESLLAAVRESLPVLIVIAVVAALTARAAAAGVRPAAETSQSR